MASRPRIGPSTRPVNPAVGEFELVGAMGIEAGGARDLAREEGEAAGDERRIGAVRPHGGNQRAGAGHQADALAPDRLEGAFVEPGKQAEPLGQRRLEVEFAAHGAFGDG